LFNYAISSHNDIFELATLPMVPLEGLTLTLSSYDVCEAEEYIYLHEMTKDLCNLSLE